MANHSRWEDVKRGLAQSTAPEAAEIDADFELGQLIYDLRLQAGLSQQALAERMSTTQSVISRLEEGGGIDTIPEGVRDELAARAARSGRSLQQFMLDEIVRLASKPSQADLVADVQEGRRRSHREIGRDVILDDRDADRR